MHALSTAHRIVSVALVLAVAGGAGANAATVALPGALAESNAALSRGEWPAYAGTYAAARYSPLDQIRPDNVKQLAVAWRWSSPDNELGDRVDPSYTHQSTPLMVNGTLYTSTSHSRVVAIDAATGVTRWMFDPKLHEKWKMPANSGWVHRGVAYWRDGDDERVIIATAHAYLIALSAKTGEPVKNFGDNGWVDLLESLRRPVARGHRYSVTSPPVIVRDIVVVGSSVLDYWDARPMPPGDVRGFDVRTGKLRWTFKTIPDDGEPGAETWRNNSAKENGNTNVWAPMSADETLGYVYLPVSTPSNDFYGGHRPGDGLYGESLVCLEASTGKKIWHYQLAHHGLWDYDLPAAPNLIDITVAGKPIKAVAQTTKQGFVFVFDRVTGAPVWPIDERPVPPSKVPGEVTAPTQPFPTKPAPIDIQGVRDEDLIDLTPELKKAAREIIAQYDYGPLYTPPTERGAISMPGVTGGASWAGASIDPETGMLYVQTQRLPFVLTLRKPGFFEGLRYDYVGEFKYLYGPQRLPLFKPPFGSLLAIDMNTGEHRWRAPLGVGPVNHPALAGLKFKERLGSPIRGWALTTKTLLLAVQSGYHSAPRPSPHSPGRTNWSLNNVDPKVYAYDKKTGELLAEIPVPANATGAPITYAVKGKQYLVFPTGGSNLKEELIAVALPDAKTAQAKP